MRDDLVVKYVCRGGGLQLTSQGKEVATKDWEPNKEAKENASPQYGGPAEQGTAATQSTQAISAAEPENARIRVLGFLVQHGGLSHRKIKRELKISDDVYDKVRAELVAEGLVEEMGKAGGGGLKLATNRKHETSARELVANAALKDFGSVKRDPAEVVQQVRRAAEEGDSIAQCKLGTMYAEGNGVSQDEAEAAKWYRLAARARQLRCTGYSRVHVRRGWGRSAGLRASGEVVSPRRRSRTCKSPIQSWTYVRRGSWSIARRH